MAHFPSWLFYMAAAFLGACVGSFLNVCIQRLPYGESVIWPPSHCRRCSRRLSWWENIPIISYLILRGRCRTCKGRISPVYVVVELLSLFLSVACWMYFQNVVLYAAYFFLLVAPLIVMAFIDLEHRVIPNILSIPGIAVGFGVHMLDAGAPFLAQAAVDSAIGTVVGGGFLFLVALAYERMRRQEGLGGGDVKLAAMLGAFFGWRAIIFILLMGSLMGSLVGLVIMIATKKNMRLALPFGPFLAGAALVHLFFGTRFITWYLGLFT